MIIKSNFSLPYPALGLDGDFSEGYFEVKPSIYAADNILHIKEESVEITNEYIKELYDKGLVSTAYKIDCPPTLFSCTSSDEKHLKIELSNLTNFINIEIFLIAVQGIDEYHHDSFNEDYFLGENKGVFRLEKGNIIGFAGSQKIGLNDTYTKGGSSIFKFSRINKSSPLVIDVEGSKIEIIYPNIDGKLDMINVMPKTKKLTFLNLFIIPALQKAFDKLKQAYEEERIDDFILEYEWAHILSIDYENYHRYDPFESAQNYLQQLLKNGNKESYTPLLEAFYKELSEK